MNKHNIAQANDSKTTYHKPIRSFALRHSRLTFGQQKALKTLWPIYGLDITQPFESRSSFGRDAPVILEIGFGNGESLIQMATAQPDINFLGVEVHQPGIGHLLLRIQEQGLSNIRIYNADAIEVLNHNIADSSLAGINLFFPDPWHKKRHHKRRIVNQAFTRLIATKLNQGGLFHAATDWEEYATHICDTLQNSPEFNRSDDAKTILAPRPLTKFESRGLRLGHDVWDLFYIRE